MVKKTLNPGEEIIFHPRTHVKALALPSLFLIVIAGVSGYLASFPDSDNENKGKIYLAIAVVAALRRTRTGSARSRRGSRAAPCTPAASARCRPGPTT